MSNDPGELFCLAMNIGYNISTIDVIDTVDIRPSDKTTGIPNTDVI